MSHWLPEHKTDECLSAGRGRKMPRPGLCQDCETKVTGRTLGGRMKRACSLHGVAAEMLEALRKCVQALKDYPQYDNPDDAQSLEAEALEDAMTAIAKADGLNP